MRNLKRALSLTLASVMLLGMMVVGSSAAAGYDDVADTDNVEAIEVLQAVEVMVGDERGFGPERPVNRAEMAVVMGKLLNLDYNYYEATCPFNDVYDWARGWVGACYANGIVSGRGEGVYDPGTTVTAVEAASMLMRALGYFKYQSDYAEGFEVATVKQANTIRLFDGVNSSTNAPLTRNQVAQMALNALKSGMVTPDGNALNFIDGNGNVIATGGKVNYVYTTSNKAFATAIDDVRASSMGSTNDAPIVELGEQLYNGSLKLRGDIDAFGRPSRHWEYDTKEIGTYVKKELIREEYTVKVTGRTLHDLLGSTTIKDYDLEVYIDGINNSAVNPNVFGKGDMVRTNDKAVGKTGKGVLTQVFVDRDAGDNGLITVAVINTYLAIADEDFDDRTDDVDITVYGIDPIPNYPKEYWKTANVVTDDGKNKASDESSPFKLELEDFPEIVDVKDGDAFLVNVAQGEVQTLGTPEILTGSQITTFKQGSYVVSGGTQYDFADATEYHFETLYDYTTAGNSLANLKDITYDIYLDQYGYAIGVKEVDRVDNYLFITGVDTNTNNRYAVQADGSAIFLDGTMEAIKIDLKAARDLHDNNATYNALTGVYSDGEKGGSLVNSWFTYTVGNDGVYQVVLVGDCTAIDNNNARAAQWVTEAKADNAADGVEKIGPKSIALRGTDKAGSRWYSVYGDDKSVYITAELSTIQDAHNTKQMVNVISGVENVVANVDEADIELWTKAAAAKQDDGDKVGIAYPWTAYGAYTLFDDDGDVIAAVVVGEDSGSVTNLVYTHEKRIESETDNNASDTRASSKGDYTWTRKVISGSTGEEILLTEVGSGLSELKQMYPNTWYVVRYNAKGEVNHVYEAWSLGGKGLIDVNAKEEKDDNDRLEDRYVNNIEELNRATNENGTVLYEVGQYNKAPYNRNAELRIGTTYQMNTKPSVDNHTFYVRTNTSESLHQGFRVADDVKTVFIQTNNNDTTTTYESGYNRLEKVVDRLHNGDKFGNTGYLYEVSAVMQNNKAIVVVIRDLREMGATGIQTNRELRLYGNLFTALDGTVTGASNAVVVANGEEVKPSRVGSDREWGNYTVYSIQAGAEVGITDYDIDDRTDFEFMTNMNYSDVRQRFMNRSLSFVMPDYNAWIDGGRQGYFTDYLVGRVGSSASGLGGVDVKFDGNEPGKSFSVAYLTGGAPTVVPVTFENKAGSTTLVEGEKYTVSLGVNYDGSLAEFTGVVEDGVLTIGYPINGTDMRNGYIEVSKLVKADGSTPVDPKPPVVDVEYTITIDATTAAHSNVTLNGNPVKDGDKVKAEDIDNITAAPAAALDVVPDNDAKTVTVKPKAGFAWSSKFEAWVGYVDGNMNMIPFGAAGSMFRLARAAEEKLPVGEVDETNDRWAAMMIRDVGSTFEIRVDDVIWVAKIPELGQTIKFELKDASMKDKAPAAFTNIDESKIFKTEDGSNTPDEPDPPITGSRKLTLKGLLADRDLKLDNQPVTVFAGPKGSEKVRITEWKLTNVATAAGEDVSAEYTVPAGHEVEIRINYSADAAGSGTPAADTNDGIIETQAGIYLIDEVPVTLTEASARDSITLTMTKDLTVEIKTNGAVPTKGLKVNTVTVNDNVTATYTSVSGKVTAATALAPGKQYLPADAQISITGVGDGAVVLVDNDGTSIANRLTNANSGSAPTNWRDKTNFGLAITASEGLTLRSAVKVTVNDTDVNVTLGTEAPITSAAAFYVALGETLKVSNAGTSNYTGFLLNAKNGKALENNLWTVAPSTETDKGTTIYGAYKVTLGEGVTATYGTAKTPITSGQYVAGTETVNAKTATGAKVAVFGNKRNTTNVTYTSVALVSRAATAADKDLTLDAATEIKLQKGVAVRWGSDKECTEKDFYSDGGYVRAEPYRSDGNGVFYVKTADKVWLKASNDKADIDAAWIPAETNDNRPLAITVDGVKDDTVESVGSVITFPVTGAAITVDVDKNAPETESAATTLITAVRNATVGGGTVQSAEHGVVTVEGGTIISVGGLGYVGAETDPNMSTSRSALGDLGVFLQGMKVVNVDVIWYKGVAYRWNTDVTTNCKWADEDGTRLMEVISGDTIGKLTKDGDSLDIALTANGLAITFRVVVDANYQTDAATGKQVYKG